MYNDATEENGRIFSLSIHPWVIGQPHRIGVLKIFLIMCVNTKAFGSLSQVRLLKYLINRN